MRLFLVFPTVLLLLSVVGRVAAQPTTGEAVCAPITPTASVCSQPELNQLLAVCKTMTPAMLEVNYLIVVPRAQAGAIDWSRLAVFLASHQELREFAARMADEQFSLNNELSTWLSNWYNVTRIIEPLAADQMMLCRLRGLSGRGFEIAYIDAMIAHLDQIRMLSETVAVSAPHDLLRQTALETAAMYARDADQLRLWLVDWYGVSLPVGSQ